MTDLSLLIGAGSVPVIIGLVKASKAWVKNPDQWPMLSVAWGIVVNVGLAYVLKQELGPAAVLGLVAGLSAAGLYDASRSVSKRKRN